MAPAVTFAARAGKKEQHGSLGFTRSLSGKSRLKGEAMIDRKGTRAKNIDWMKVQAARGRMSRREFIQLGLAIGLTVPLADAMFGAALASTPKKGGRFRLGISWGATTNTLDPAAIVDSYTAAVNQAIRSNIFTVDDKGGAVPDLAESLEPSDGTKTWALALKKGITFHNGKDLTAEDVIASIRHHMGEQSKSSAKSVVAQIADMKADAGKVVFTLKGGNADFPYVLAEPRLSIMAANADGSVDWQSGIGTGPYVLEQFKPGEVMTGKRNPNFHLDTWFDEIELRSVIDPTARTAALVSGELDAMDRPEAKSLDFLAANPEVAVDKIAGYGHSVFSMNVTAPPFDNVDVRTALKYAIDREEIIKKIWGGIGIPGNDNPIAPSIKFAIDPQPRHVYDPEKARSLLAKAGMPNLKVQLSAADAAFTGAVDAATLYRESAAKAGIDLEIVREANDGYWDNVWLKKAFVASDWYGRPTVDAQLTFAYAADSSQNETFYKSPRFNEILVSARSELDEAKRAAMYAEAQQLLHDEGGVIVILFSNYLIASSKKLAHGPLHSNLDLDGMRITQRWWFV